MGGREDGGAAECSHLTTWRNGGELKSAPLPPYDYARKQTGDGSSISLNARDESNLNASPSDQIDSIWSS